MCDRSRLKGADDPLMEMLLSEGDDLDAAHVQRFLHRIMKAGRPGVRLQDTITDSDMRRAWEECRQGNLRH